MASLSIVTTVYKSENHILDFLLSMHNSVKDLNGLHFIELIVVNDGSPDGSKRILRENLEFYPKLKVVNLARNFGHHEAIMAGLDASKGDYVFLIDSDMEEDPFWIAEFWETLKKTDSDVVFGYQENRKGGISERIAGNIYYKLIPLLSGETLPTNVTTARIMTRGYVNALLQYTEKSMLIGALWHLAGFKQTGMPVKKLSESKTTYTLFRKLSLAMRAVTSISARPLKWLFGFGIILFGIASFILLWTIWQAALGNKPLSGWSSTVVSIWFLGSLNFAAIGLVGAYVAVIFEEVKSRPRTIIKSVESHYTTIKEI